MKFFGVVALSLLMIPAFACKHSQSLPQEVVGNWVTDDPRYQDKNLIIDQDGYIVLILDAESKPKPERVDRMTATHEAGVSTYVFETTDAAGAHHNVTVSCRAVKGGELRLSHPSDVVWHRAAAE